MHVMAFPLAEAAFADRVHEARGGTVEELRWRNLWLVAEFHINGVPLAGADLPAVLAEGKTLLFICGDDFLELLHLQGPAVARERSQERFHVDPAGGIQCQS